MSIQSDAISDQPVTHDTAIKTLCVQRLGKRSTVGKNPPGKRAAFSIFISNVTSKTRGIALI